MRTITTWLIACITAIAMTALSGCTSTSTPPDGDRPVVYASFYPIQNLVESVSGDAVEVRSFMPEGQDPHLWEPTPRNMKELADADLLVVNGANMEPWLDQVRESLPHLDVLVLSDYVELITYKGAAALGEFQYLASAPLQPGQQYSLVFGHTHEKSMRAAFFRDDADPDADTEELVARGRETMGEQGKPTPQHESFDVADGQVYDIEMGHEHGDVTFTVPTVGPWYFVSDRMSEDILSYRIVDADGNEVPTTPVIPGSSTATDKVTYDPHSWMSIINAKRYANAIHGDLTTRFPEHAGEFDRNKFALVRSLTKLQSEYNEKFRHASRREFIVSHSAFAYLARDFGLTQRPLQGLTTSEAPSLSSLVSAIRYARDNDIRIVYHEPGEVDTGIQTIVDEVDGEALPLASMEQVEPSNEMEDGYIGHLRMNLENLHASLQ